MALVVNRFLIQQVTAEYYKGGGTQTEQQAALVEPD